MLNLRFSFMGPPGIACLGFDALVLSLNGYFDFDFEFV